MLAPPDPPLVSMARILCGRLRGSRAAQWLGTAGRVLGLYAAWLASCGIGLLNLIAMREAVLDLYVALRLSKWGYGAVANWSMFLFGLVWLVGAIYLETYYREGAARGRFLRRFLRATAVQAALLAFATMLIELAHRIA
jgi:hypothetical protein